MKKVWLTAFLFAIVFVVGCGGGNDTTPANDVFRGGSQGVFADFEPFGVEENGVFTIFDTESFPIEVKVQNKGEEELLPGDVKVTLKGINLDDFTGLAAPSVMNARKIGKATEFVPDGEEELLDFTPGDGAKYKFKVTGYYQPDVFAEIDYNYKTHLLAPQVCFKEDIGDASVCNPRESKSFFVSGAPVTVTSVAEDIAGRGIMVLVITVSNVGGGRVTLPGAEFNSRYDQMSFNLENDADKWECRSSGRENEARFVAGSAVITCKLRQPLGADELYTKQVEMTLSYTYRSVIQETIRIKESAD